MNCLFEKTKINKKRYGNVPFGNFCQYNVSLETRIRTKAGSPGLVVVGRDSRSKGLGFESQHHTLDGHFSQIIVVKIVLFV